MQRKLILFLLFALLSICLFVYKQLKPMQHSEYKFSLSPPLVKPNRACNQSSQLIPHPRLAGGPLPIVCADRDCRLAYAKQLQTAEDPYRVPKIRHAKQLQTAEDPYRVPKIRHILWKSQRLPNFIIKHIRSWYKLHPDWTYVLWRESEFDRFVGAHFRHLLPLFKFLPHQMMRVDMIRYMLLYKYGGTYADADFRLVKSLDEFRRFPSTIIREPESHSLSVLGMAWPIPILATPGFMMAAPDHAFFKFALNQLAKRRDRVQHVLEFAGPIALTEILETYKCTTQTSNRVVQDMVYIPPSFSFCSFPGNRHSLSKNPSIELQARLDQLNRDCRKYHSRVAKPHRNLTEFCADVNNMDSITDSSQPVYAEHDRSKPSTWNDAEKNLPAKWSKSSLSDVKVEFKGLLLDHEYMKMTD